MNFLRLLLAFYFVALSLMPCNDATEQSTSDSITFSISKNQGDSHSQSDSCSPLCFCNCCRITAASFKIDPILEYPKQIESYFSKKILFSKNDFAYLVYDQIWQPPKI